MDYRKFMSDENIEKIRRDFGFFLSELPLEQSLFGLAHDIGISRFTLRSFIKGNRVYMRTLRKIANWCEKRKKGKSW